MPLTTYLPEQELELDATRSKDDVGGGMSWDQVCEEKPLMKCRECDEVMHPRGGKPTSNQRAHFYHHKKNDLCSGGEESPNHRELKRLCAEGIREAGWQAHLEYAGPDGDWRADVLAEDPQSGRRVAFEIQLSPQTAEQAEYRTERYRAAGVECVWIVTKNRQQRRKSWFRAQGALVVNKRGDEDDSAEWNVLEGCQRYEPGAFRGAWSDVDPPVPLRKVVPAIVRGQVVPSQDEPQVPGTDWWWVNADHREHWPTPAQRHEEDDVRARQGELKNAAIAAAQNEWPNLHPARVRTADPKQRQCVRYGDLVRVRFEGGPRLFALLLPDLIKEDERDLPVLADTWSAAQALSLHEPAIWVTVPEGDPPWRLYRYNGETWVAGRQFGTPGERTSSQPGPSPRPTNRPFYPNWRPSSRPPTPLPVPRRRRTTSPAHTPTRPPAAAASASESSPPIEPISSAATPSNPPPEATPSNPAPASPP